jgi:hypothetical protein
VLLHEIPLGFIGKSEKVFLSLDDAFDDTNHDDLNFSIQFDSHDDEGEGDLLFEKKLNFFNYTDGAGIFLYGSFLLYSQTMKKG